MACFFYKFGLIILTWEISPRLFFMHRVWLLSVFRKRRDRSSGLKLLIFFSILYWYGVFCCCLWYLSCLFTYETLLKYTDNCINVILIIYSLFSDVFQLKITLIQVTGLKGCKLETFISIQFYTFSLFIHYWTTGNYWKLQCTKNEAFFENHWCVFSSLLWSKVSKRKNPQNRLNRLHFYNGWTKMKVSNFL